jgi:glucan biosynthesis protein C
MAQSRQIGAQPKRRREMDLMGLTIVVGLVFFHSAQIFSGTDHYVENTQQGMATGLAANLFLAFGSMWGMPLMMLIAGTAIWYSLRKRTGGQFLLNRVRRLLIPFVTGMVLVFPPVVWFSLKFHLPSYSGNYWQFLGRWFDVRFSLSAFPWFLEGAPPERLWKTGHLWFLIYPFVYTLLLLPLFWFLRKPSGQRLVARCVGFLTLPWAIFLLALPIGLIEAFLLTETDGVWNRFVWPFFIVYGFLLASDRQFGRVLQRHRKSAILLGIVAFVAHFGATGYLVLVHEANYWTDYSTVGLLGRFFKGLGSWFWVVAIMGMAGHMSQRGARQDRVVLASTGNPDPPPLEALRGPTGKDRLADYAKEAQLPFYVLHRTPIIIIGFYVVQWQVNALVKYVVIVLGALVTILVVYDIAVRRTWPTRFLFGLRPGKTKG